MWLENLVQRECLLQPGGRGSLLVNEGGLHMDGISGGTEISETGRWTVWSVKGMEWTGQEEALEAELAYMEKRATGQCGP